MTGVVPWSLVPFRGCICACILSGTKAARGCTATPTRGIGIDWVLRDQGFVPGFLTYIPSKARVQVFPPSVEFSQT